jgi:cell division protein YceG involved in septum cleavage
VFGDVSYDPGSTTYKVVEIPVDASTLEIGAALEDAGIIEDKYVFWARVKVKGYGNQIYSGTYGLSASMNVDEILNIICHLEDEEDE